MFPYFQIIVGYLDYIRQSGCPIRFNLTKKRSFKDTPEESLFCITVLVKLQVQRAGASNSEARRQSGRALSAGLLQTADPEAD